VRKTQRHAEAESISLFGYCIGGILTTIYSALHPQAPLRNVIFLAAPVDFSDAGLFGTWLDPRCFNVERVVEGLGNMPGELVEMGAKMLRPVTNYVTPYVNLAQRHGDDQFVRGWAAMHKWVHDRVDFPGAAFRQLVRDLYQENRLIRGRLRIGGQTVRVANIHWPALIIAAERDHITPLGSTIPLYERIASADKHKLVIPAGHVGLVAGRGAVKDLWPKVADWLAPRSD
jgi:polyhydroxyalkanoate synthase